MASASIIVGLVLVLGFQVAIHLRIAGIPKRVATLKLVTEGSSRPDAINAVA